MMKGRWGGIKGVKGVNSGGGDGEKVIKVMMVIKDCGGDEV